jgi:predicted transcriptional regulator
LGIHNEGMSQRKIADIVGCDQKTVSKVIGEENERSVKITQEETLEVEGEEKRPMAKITQEEEEEDTTSVFTHCTSVEPVANPWVCLTI